MSGIIPTPTMVGLATGSYALPRTVRVAVDERLVAAPLDDAMARINELTEHQATAVWGGNESAEILIRLVDADPILDGLRSTHGLSPADRDPADERYVIEVTESGIEVRATAAEGLARGIASLTQLIVGGAAGEVSIQCQCIVDAPRFAWRGLSVDVVRTFFPPTAVKAVIDMLALYKMNVLHLHLTDNQGWRLEIPSLPQLTGLGAVGAVGNRPGGFYSPAEFQDIINYAAERFVTVVPEIDVPGHAGAILKSYPELRSPDQASHDYDPSAGYLDPRMESTREFLSQVFTHLAKVIPGPYLHIGGDEAFGMPETLYQEFIALVLPLVRATGKKVIGWQEIARGDLSSSDIIQYWVNGGIDVREALNNLPAEFAMGPEMIEAMVIQFKNAGLDLQKAQEQGAHVLLSPTTVAYFDTPHAETSISREQELRRPGLGFRAYPPKSTADSIAWDPETVIPEADMSGVIGIEAAVWCETVESEADLHMLLLPRLAGFAEKGWSPQDSLIWDEYSQRLAAQAPLWRQAGWHFFESSLVEWS
ncbi:family 20 glycosylhydrolase [Paenarthrobacter sp. NPDC056912]|uniref:family 20 glycosylhydrolase n=1 Tax=Paenarthrobacter sp. NPDC056912 TaxID=3345965 RepID=UPI003670D170